MDRISTIKVYIGMTERTDSKTDPQRWDAARLIWEELQTGKTLRDLGEEISKSHMYVQYMKRTWEISGKDVYEMSGFKGRVLYPDFKSIFYSEEVRGKAYQETRGKRRGRDKKDKEPNEQEDTSAHGMIAKAAELIKIVSDNPAFWQTLEYEDIDNIREIVMDSDDIMEGWKNHKARTR